MVTEYENNLTIWKDGWKRDMTFGWFVFDYSLLFSKKTAGRPIEQDCNTTKHCFPPTFYTQNNIHQTFYTKIIQNMIATSTKTSHTETFATKCFIHKRIIHQNNIHQNIIHQNTKSLNIIYKTLSVKIVTQQWYALLVITR